MVLLNVVGLGSPRLISQISYEAVASPHRERSDLALLIYSVALVATYIGPLTPAHARIDDDRHNIVLLNGVPLASTHWTSQII